MPDFPAVPAGLQHLFAVPLDLFSAAEVAALQARIELRSMRGKATPHVDCIIRDKEIMLKPAPKPACCFSRNGTTPYARR